jgi:homoserine O-succinyltransferase
LYQPSDEDAGPTVPAPKKADEQVRFKHMKVALVNNMPDPAFIETEDQFRRATAVGPDGEPVQLELYTITEIPRSEALSSVIESRYHGLEELWTRPPDALIVTGTEPAQVQLRYEPYWPYLARLLEWAADSVPTTLLSCLAAHAFTLLFDGLERVPRAVKCSGVFAGTVCDPDDPLARGLPEQVRVPHSRVNDVPEEAIVAAGYRVVIGAGDSGAGWAVAAREQRGCLFVLCQGHPEYATLSLLREYRRDVRRCLFGRGAVPYPRMPEGYLGAPAVATFEEFARRAAERDADPVELWATFPYEQAAATVKNTWAPASATLYANWMRLAHAAAPVRA